MNGRKKISTLNLILIVQLVIMIILSTVITKTISRTTKNNSIEHMLTITGTIRPKLVIVIEREISLPGSQTQRPFRLKVTHVFSEERK